MIHSEGSPVTQFICDIDECCLVGIFSQERFIFISSICRHLQVIEHVVLIEKNIVVL